MEQRTTNRPSILKAWLVIPLPLLLLRVSTFLRDEVDWAQFGRLNTVLWWIVTRVLVWFALMGLFFSLFWLIHCYEARARERDREDAKRKGLKQL